MKYNMYPAGYNRQDTFEEIRSSLATDLERVDQEKKKKKKFRRRALSESSSTFPSLIKNRTEMTSVSFRKYHPLPTYGCKVTMGRHRRGLFMP